MARRRSLQRMVGLNPLSHQMMPVIALWQITAKPVASLDDYHRELSPRWLGNRENCVVTLRGGHGDAEHCCSGTARRGRPARNGEPIAPLPEAAWLGGVMALLIVGRGAAGGRDSTEPTPHRSCLGTEISSSVIQRGRRRIPRWLCLDGG